MFTTILLSLAAAGSSPSQQPITVLSDVPRVVIPIADYDLGRAGDVLRLRWRIRAAAKEVCDNPDSYRGIEYMVANGCVKSAVAGGNAQLDNLLAGGPSTALTTAIAITAPAN